MVSPVPVLSIVFCVISALITFGIPIALLIFCMRKSRHGLMAACTGALCFIISALVLEQILHAVVLSLFPAVGQIPILYILYGCLAAGLFEETARLIGLRFLCRKWDSSAVTGLAYGVGHGGIEAIMMVGTTMLSNLMVMWTINTGGVETLLAGLEGDTYDLALSQLQLASAIPPAEFLVGGVERLIAMVLHLSLSMLIWMVVTKRLPMGCYPLAIALHAVSNLPAGLYQALSLNLWLTEALTFVIVADIAFGVWKLYQSHRDAPAAQA